MNLASLIRKLEAELLETDSPMDDWERAYRKGWNARAMSLIGELKGETLAPGGMDLALKQELVK
jgi:hypothetical protein